MQYSNTLISRINREEEDTLRRDYAERFCRYCGGKIPFGSRFCPECGRSLKEKPAETRPNRFTTDVLQNVSRVRMVTFIVSFILFIGFLFMGSQTPLSPAEATQVLEEVGQAFSSQPMAVTIALNNILINLLCFIPLFGTLFLAFVSHNTGIVLSAVAIVAELTAGEVFVTTLSFPWFWLEVTAYSLASSQGIILLRAIIKRDLKKEAKKLLIVLTVCVILLVVGAGIETLAVVS